MINIDNYRTKCPGCFKDVPGGNVCPHCKFDESKARSPLFLPYRTILNEQYIMGKELGCPGGFGITYLAFDSKLDRCVAIKEYLPKDIAGRGSDTKTIEPYSDNNREDYQKGLKGFMKEAKRVAKFHEHPNIVNVMNFFEENGTGYLVMEYYPGRNLSEFLNEKGGKVSESDAMDIIMPVLDGLREVHRHNYIHRDIKPANIYITNGGRPIIIDFGNARFATGHSQSMTAIVSRGYAPYEQYGEGGKQGCWTDIYSCGATLYKIVTGKEPPLATDRKSRDNLVAPSKLVSWITPGFNKAILKAMEMEPGRRPKDVDEFRRMLKPKAKPMGTSKSVNSQAEESSEHHKPSIPGWLWGAGGLGMGAIIAVVIVMFMIKPNKVPVNKTMEKPVYEDKSNNNQLVKKTQTQTQTKTSRSSMEKAGESTDPITDMEFVYVNGGCYQMGDTFGDGSEDEKPVHEACVDDFYIGKYEVTQGPWEDVMGSNPSVFKKGRSYPVENVSWNDVQEFIERLNQKSSKKYRLLTEAEWEYAARSEGKKEKYAGFSNENDLYRYANFCDTNCLYDWKTGQQDDGYENTSPVGNYRPNSLGIYDMSGNVWEWCQDIYDKEAYRKHQRNNPIYMESGSGRVIRGGSWIFDSGDLRASDRYGSTSGYRNGDLGFRLARTP